jgi:hypothetical protein
LETSFRTERGEVHLLDSFTMRGGGTQHPYRQILRILEGRKGEVRVRIQIVPRFDYGAIRPWVRPYPGPHYFAMGGKDGLLLPGISLSKRRITMIWWVPVRSGKGNGSVFRSFIRSMEFFPSAYPSFIHIGRGGPWRRPSDSIIGGLTFLFPRCKRLSCNDGPEIDPLPVHSGQARVPSSKEKTS